MASKRNDKKAAAGRDDVVRAVFQPGIELRDAGEGVVGQPLVMSGHLAVFNKWTEIRSAWEGNFMEMLSPGAFTKTISENRANIKVLYDHGMSAMGNLPLGSITELREDGTGCYYEVELLDTDYVGELVPGLKAGLFGASFRFQVVRDEWNDQPKPSGDNPQGMPERIIREVKMAEFGPVTFPAYSAATAGVRGRQEFSIWRDLDEEGRTEFAEFIVRARFKDVENLASGGIVECPHITVNMTGTTDPASIAAEIKRALTTGSTTTTTTTSSSTHDSESDGVEETQELRTSEDEVIADTEPDGAEDVEVRSDDAATSSTDDAPDSTQENHSHRLSNSAAWRMFLLEEEGVIQL